MFSGGEDQKLIDYQKEFIAAAENGDLAKLKNLYEDKSKNINPNLTFSNGEESFTALYIAAQNNKIEIVRYLLEIKDINIHLGSAHYDLSPLHIAVYNGHINVVNAFLLRSQKEEKLIPNIQRSLDGTSLLHFAAKQGHVDIAKLLLGIGADPNIKNCLDWTPLHYASEQGHIEIAQLLLATGADPNAKTKNGATPLDKAVFGNQLKVCALLEDFEQDMHSCLIQRMKALGFESSAQGVCFGFSEVAALFALSGEKVLNHFDNTLFLLKSLKVKELLIMQKMHDNLFQQAERETIQELHFQNKVLDAKEKVHLHEITKQKCILIRKKLTKEQQEKEDQYLDILSLFNGIELAFQGYKYPYLFPKYDLILISDEKKLEEKMPQLGQLLIAPSENDSVRYKLKNLHGSYKEHRITQEELKLKFKDRYNELTHSLNNIQISKLSTFLPDFLEIIEKKDHLLPEKRLTSQHDNLKWVPSLIQPKALDEKRGTVQLVLFTGAYKKEELSTYFKTFRMRLNEKKVTTPVLLSLDYSNHLISIMYDPMNDIQRIFDINRTPFKPDELKEHIFTGDIDISQKIAIELFSKEGNAIFQTRVSTTKDAESIVKSAIDVWMEDLKSLHAITKEKACLLDHIGASWVWISARAGEVETMQQLLYQSADVNHQNVHGVYPLHAAVHNGHIKAVITLLSDPNLKPNITCISGQSALYIAAFCGRADIVKTLLEAKLKEKINPNSKADDGNTPLMAAIEKGYNDIVELLLKITDIEFEPKNNGLNPLYLAVQRKDLNIIKMILEKSNKIDPNHCYNEISSLYLAVANGDIEIVNLLLTATFKIKLDVNKKTNEITALYLAAQKGQTEVVRALLKAGACVDTLNKKQYTPVYIAAHKGHAKVIQVLAETKADFNFSDAKGNTPLIVAVKKGHVNVIKTLLETGRVNVNKMRSVDGCTALHVAIAKRRVDIIELLLQSNKVIFGLCNKKGLTPLSLAIANDQLNIVGRILNYKAHIFKKTKLPRVVSMAFEKCSTYEAKDAIELKTHYIEFIHMDAKIFLLVKKAALVLGASPKLEEIHKLLYNVYTNYIYNSDFIAIAGKLSAVETYLNREEIEKRSAMEMEVLRIQKECSLHQLSFLKKRSTQNDKESDANEQRNVCKSSKIRKVHLPHKLTK
jgi:ankyrin repeat protein